MYVFSVNNIINKKTKNTRPLAPNNKKQKKKTQLRSHNRHQANLSLTISHKHNTKIGHHNYPSPTPLLSSSNRFVNQKDALDAT